MLSKKQYWFSIEVEFSSRMKRSCSRGMLLNVWPFLVLYVLNFTLHWVVFNGEPTHPF